MKLPGSNSQLIIFIIAKPKLTTIVKILAYNIHWTEISVSVEKKKKKGRLKLSRDRYITSSFSGHPEKNAGSEIGSERNDCSRFNRRPVGGSFVIFTPFCRMFTGN